MVIGLQDEILLESDILLEALTPKVPIPGDVYILYLGRNSALDNPSSAIYLARDHYSPQASDQHAAAKMNTKSDACVCFSATAKFSLGKFSSLVSRIF